MADRVTRFRCVVCGKMTAGRMPRDGRYVGDTTARYPRRHTVDGNPCPGNVREADWVDVPNASVTGAAKPRTVAAGLGCPFCGATEHDHDTESGLHGTQVNVCASKDDGSDVWFASCNVCGASGPLCDDADMAKARFTKPNAAAVGRSDSDVPTSGLLANESTRVENITTEVEE